MNDDIACTKLPHLNGHTPRTRTQHASTTPLPIHDWRRIPLSSSPQLFTITMATGITTLLLSTYPYPATWLTYLAYTIAFLHLALLLFLLTLTLLRAILFPNLFLLSLHHPSESLYYGALPVSLLSLANILAAEAAPSWGPWAAYLAWSLWMLASTLALIVAIGVPLAHFLPPPPPSATKQTAVQTPTALLLSSITPAHLLPAIAAIVAANTAAPVASALLALSPPSLSASYASSILLAGLILWSIGVPSSLLFLSLYFARLTLCGGRLPRDSVVAALVSVGPLNMGAAGVVGLGSVARGLLGGQGQDEGRIDMGEVVYGVGLVVGVVMWAWGIVWGVWAVGHVGSAALERRGGQDGCEKGKRRGSVKGLPFNLTTWSAIFPLGTVGLSSGRLGAELPSAFFRVVGAAVSALVAVLLVVVGGLTLWDLCVGQMKVEDGGKTRGTKVLVSKAAEEWEAKRRAVKSGRDDEMPEKGEDGPEETQSEKLRRRNRRTTRDAHPDDTNRSHVRPRRPAHTRDEERADDDDDTDIEATTLRNEDSRDGVGLKGSNSSTNGSEHRMCGSVQRDFEREKDLEAG